MTLVEPDLDLNEATTQDPDEVAHIVIPKAAWTEAIVMGTPVEALCGYVWVPSREAKDLPVCEGCKWVYDQMRAAQGKPPGDWG